LRSRRTFLAVAAIVAGSFAAQPRVCQVAANDDLRGEMQRFLGQLSAEGTPAYVLHPALAAAVASLQPRQLHAIRSRAEAGCVAANDYLAYNLVEALPVSPHLLALNMPEVVAFVVPATEQQHAIASVALRSPGPVARWVEGEPASGLVLGSRLGFHMGANNTLVGVVVSSWREPRLGPGVPGTMALRTCLEDGRSPAGALASLRQAPAPRRRTFLIYDSVTGTATLVTQDTELRASPVTSDVVVLASDEEGAAENTRSLRASIEANLGWLSGPKAMRLLQLAVPGWTYLVLDIDERKGIITSLDGQQRDFDF